MKTGVQPGGEASSVDAGHVIQLRRELDQAKKALEVAEKAELDLHAVVEGLEKEKAEVGLHAQVELPLIL